MSHARRLIVSLLGAVLLAVPVTHSQDVKTPKAKAMVIQMLPIQALGLQPWRGFDGLWQAAPVAAPAVGAPDLSRYRDFQFGETLPAIEKQVGLPLSDAKLIHERPAVLQELEWQIWLSGNSPPQPDAVRSILFSFYNGKLYRFVVNYDQHETAGLTTEDMITAISARYGTATRPLSTEIVFSSTQVYDDGEHVIARWEDAQYSFNLYRSTYQPTFGIVAFAKQLDALARTATTEAIRLDAQEAPQREIQRQQKEDEKNRELLEKARQANKSNFHP
jgi:hypothetical protein